MAVNARIFESVSNGKKIATITIHPLRRTTETGPRNQTVRNTGNVLLYDFDSVTDVSNEITLLHGESVWLGFIKTKKKCNGKSFDSTGDIIFGRMH
jgi:hypothetical protein